MKKSRAFFFVFLWPLAIWAADPIATVVLKNGKTYHAVRVLKNNATTIDVSSDEGLFQLRKIDLPETLAKQYPIDASAAAAEQQAHDEQVRSAEENKQARLDKIAADQKAKMAEREKRLVRNGCRIVDFHQVLGGLVQLEIRNETDLPVQLNPNMLLAVSTDGKVYDGFWVVRREDGKIRRSENVMHLAGRGTSKPLMQFSRSRDITITDVYWADDGRSVAVGK